MENIQERYMNYGKPEERERRISNIVLVPLPARDLVSGTHDKLFDYWKDLNGFLASLQFTFI